jgi:hypothetical protein
MVQAGDLSIRTQIPRPLLVGLVLSCAAPSCPESIPAQPLFPDQIFELAPPNAWAYERTNPFTDVFLQVADLDGDGIPDLAGVVGSGVSVAWGNDDGTFTPLWLSGNLPCCLLIGSAVDAT